MADNALNFMALFAGKYPAAMPMNVAKTKEAPHSHKGMEESISLLVRTAMIFTIFEEPKLMIMPKKPPAKPMNAASVKNNFLISAKEAPITFITPISLVLS